MQGIGQLGATSEGFYFVSSGAVALQACWPRALAHYAACTEDKMEMPTNAAASFLPLTAALCWENCFQIAQFYTN